MTLAVALTAVGAPRVSYFRILPPPHPLPGEDVAIVYAVGDPRLLAPFVENFMEHANRSGALRIDAVSRPQLYARRAPDRVTMNRVRRQYPRDAYLGIGSAGCVRTERSGEGSTLDMDGKRIPEHHQWMDAICTVKLSVIDAETGAAIGSFEVKGEGTTARAVSLSEEDRAVAIAQAAHMAAFRAAEAVCPRQVRESIELDDAVAGFDRVVSLIDAGRLPAARRLLEQTARAEGDSAALHYDIAAICEALGDVDAARRHYDAARQLAPSNRRYSHEFEAFRKRSGH